MKYFKTTQRKKRDQPQEQLLTTYQPTFDAFGNPIIFSMTLSQNISSTDSTLLWQVMKPTPVVNRGQRNPVIVFRKSTLYFQTWQIADLPRCIYINIDGFPGMLDQNGAVTQRVARFELKQQILLQQVPATYSAIYQLISDTLWQLPPQLTNLSFRVSFDDNTQPETLPLAKPFPLKLEFLRFMFGNIQQNLRAGQSQNEFEMIL